MAELDFRHSVSEIPAGATLPKPFQSSERIQVVSSPDIQSAMSNYAASTNWLSSIGSEVASRASNAIATKLGSELGKKPQGDLGIPLTEFDKTLQSSYQTQAHATLGLQANKLITDSNIEAAKANRITPELISRTNKSLSIGLKNIFANAPAEIRPNLELQYGTLQLSQAESLSRRMVQEQRDDRRNNTALANQMNAEHAYSFGLNGNDKAALEVIETTRKLNESNVAARITDPLAAKASIDTARKSYLSGKMVHDYETARSQGKGEEYLKSIADKKPDYLSDADYEPVIQNLISYVAGQNRLRSQDQQLRLASFDVDLAKNPVAPDMASKLQDLQNNVSPIAYQNAQLAYIKAKKTYERQQGDLTDAFASWSNPTTFTRLTDKAVNSAFDAQVARLVQQRQQQNNPISQENAEVQIAASAGGKVPVFVDTLRNKLNSGNPEMMSSAARQMDQLYSINKSHALLGLSDNDKAIFSQFKSLRDSLPAEEAAKVAIQNANQDSDTQKMNKERWSSYVKAQSAGRPPQMWALRQVDLNPDEFMNPGIANEYGNMIFQKYAAFYQMTNGDGDNALKLTKQEVNDNFGYTEVNGKKVKTLRPIEKVLGYDNNREVVPFIQDDIIAKLNKSFVPLKESFGKNESNVYWDVVASPSREQTQKKNNTLFDVLLHPSHKNQPIQVKRYTKTANGIKSDTYNVAVIGNSFNWDLALETSSGIRPIIQIAPYLGIQTYSPDKKSIDENYMKHHGVK